LFGNSATGESLESGKVGTPKQSNLENESELAQKGLEGSSEFTADTGSNANSQIQFSDSASAVIEEVQNTTQNNQSTNESNDNEADSSETDSNPDISDVNNSTPVLNYCVQGSNGKKLPLSRSNYKSPFLVKFSFSIQNLIGDFLSGERGVPQFESEVPFSQWYSNEVKQRWGHWGPPPKNYPAPAGLSSKTDEWKRQRVLATAMRFIGYRYQQHRIPDWLPPAQWPQTDYPIVKERGKGLDCSNFTSFVYNQALGLKFTTSVKKQAWLTKVGNINVKKIEIGPRELGLAAFSALKPGDLLFLKNKEGGIGHVVFWIGQMGNTPDSEAMLVLDSAGECILRDSSNQLIPNGIYLRQIKANESNWYFRMASHALRFIN
jgi:cell wall-associated NlpC family hydrolase